MTATTPPPVKAKTDKIAGLLLRGFSLDLVSELGVSYGWTRDEVKTVCRSRGWALDWSGRLQQLSLAQAAFLAIPLKDSSALLDASAEAMINVGSDHGSAAVRMRAERAQAAVEALRLELAIQEGRERGRSAPSAAQNGSGQDQKGCRVSAHQNA